MKCCEYAQSIRMWNWYWIKYTFQRCQRIITTFQKTCAIPLHYHVSLEVVAVVPISSHLTRNPLNCFKTTELMRYRQIKSWNLLPASWRVCRSVLWKVGSFTASCIFSKGAVWLLRITKIVFEARWDPGECMFFRKLNVCFAGCCSGVPLEQLSGYY